MVRELFRTGRGFVACAAGLVMVGVGVLRLNWQILALGVGVIGLFTGIAYLSALGSSDSSGK